MSRVFLIDTDTASDDAIALIMALRAADVQVAAITTVAGNVDVEQATRNALYTVELCGAEVPVYKGAERPLVRPPHENLWFHGNDGFGDHGYPPPRRSAEKLKAVDAICKTIEANAGLVLVALGPLTNLALAVSQKPDIVQEVSRCVVMGGAAFEGNVTPVAEYNVWADPEAARTVFHSGLPIELVGWHLATGEAILNAKDIEFVSSLSSKRAHFAIESTSWARQANIEETGDDGIPLADPVAMSIALDPSIGTSWGKYWVEVETTSELTRGMTVIDRHRVAEKAQNRSAWAALLEKRPNVNVCWTIDIERWKERLYSALR